MWNLYESTAGIRRKVTLRYILECRKGEWEMLQGKQIVLGVTGSIAAYKAASLASMLKKQGADVTVIMTENAANFINPITFEELTGNK